jgi:amino acid adenylation domain-containing protein
MSTGNFNPFAAGEIERVAPSTFAQREVIASSQMSDEASTAFNEGVTVQIEGPLNLVLFESSFQVLIGRHESFRSTFSRKGDEICLQESARGRFVHVDISDMGINEQSGYLKDLYHNIAISPMNLEEGPLFFAWLVRLGEQSHQLVLAAHHVICDGWSFGLLLQELSKIYTANGKANSLSASPSFLDFAEKHCVSQIANKDVDFWQAKFTSVPPNLDLPLDFKRPAQRTFAASRLDYSMGGDFASKLKTASSSMKVSVVNLMLSAYTALLFRLSGNEDIVVGLPVAGQAAMNNLSLIGHMVQLLPIRVKMTAETPFSELLSQVKGAVLDASEHPEFTYGELIKDLPVDRSRVPLISTIFNIDQQMPALSFGDASGNVDSIPRASENFELFLNIVPKKDELVIEATYSTVLFREKTIESWMGALKQILLGVFEKVETPVGQLALANSEPEFCKEINDTAYTRKFNSMIEAVEHSVAVNADKEALICADRRIDYRTLWQKVTGFAAYLANAGVSEGQVVGICCERSENLIISTLALHSLGAAYLPLDPTFPKDRLLFIYEDANAAGVIVDKLGKRLLSESVDSLFDVLGTAEQANFKTLSHNPDRLAYIIYTSGSTGKPKGVEISWSSMINLLESMLVQPGFSASNTLLAVTTLAFDISIVEIFLPLMVGGRVVIAEQEDLKDGEAMSRLIQTHEVNYLQSTPATFRLLLASSWKDNADRKLKALCCGEPLPPSLADGLIPRVHELWNMFGPTETTVYATRKLLVNPKEQITIGRPIENTQTFILDEYLKPVPLSVPGELCIAGDNLAIAYHGRLDLTDEKFVTHPCYGRIYRTGDLAKWSVNGDIVHLGRIDDQVKVRGYRIELGEIERTITETGLVEGAAAYLWYVSEADIRIVACFVGVEKQEVPVTQLRKALRSKLPAYMIPQYFLPIDTIPLSNSGKVNRKALPRPQERVSHLVNSGELNTETEKRIAQIWAGLVKSGKSLGPEDSFFDIGGHSLLALEAIRQIDAYLGVRLNIKDLITLSLQQIASEIDGRAAKQEMASNEPQSLPLNQERGLSGDQSLLLKRQLRWPGSLSHNVEGAWQLDGELVLEDFQLALKMVFERQTAFRTHVQLTENRYVQKIAPVQERSISEFVDCSDSDNALQEAFCLAEEMFHSPFQMLNSQLYRLVIYRLSKTKHLLVLACHQLVFDGWSYDIFLRELSEAYQAIRDKRVTKLPPLPYEFRDYCEWLNNHENTPDYTKALEFHKASLPSQLGQKNLFENSAAGEGASYRKDFNLEQYRQLVEHCEELGLREHELIFALLCISVSEAFDQPEVLMGVRVTGRYLPDVANLVGSFVSTVPLNIHVPSLDIRSVCKSIAELFKEFHSHREVSLTNIIEETVWQDIVSLDELLQISFSFQDVRKRENVFSNLVLSQSLVPRHQTELPLEAWVRLEQQGFVLFFDYDKARVSNDIVESLGEGFSRSFEKLNASEVVQCENTTNEPKKSLWRRLFS